MALLCSSDIGSENDTINELMLQHKKTHQRCSDTTFVIVDLVPSRMYGRINCYTDLLWCIPHYSHASDATQYYNQYHTFCWELNTLRQTL